MEAHTEDTVEQRFAVVVNVDERYSIWVAGRDLPAGWRAEGFEGSRDACLDHIESVWTD